MQLWEQHLARWEAAAVVDADTAARIRAYEAAEAHPAGQRWQILVALILGGILLAAGVLLFVAAHWDEVSPMGRFGLVVGLLAALHVAAIVAADRFPAMATALHGVGTVGAGAAIAMVGQIFNMQEHWPAAVLLWALCAAAGYWWLRDQFQQVCLLLLAPAWLICEWTYRAQPYTASDVYLCRMLAVLCAVYLTAFVHSRRLVVFGMLFGIAGIGLVVVTTELAEEGWRSYSLRPLPVPAHLRVLAIAIMLALIAAGYLWERRSLPVTLAVAAASFALPWLHKLVTEHPTYPGAHDYTYSVPNLASYAVVGLVAMLFAWWGVRERSRALVNYGVAVFAITVGWFYFSDLMDKLGRSLGLIGLGVVFLAGGWLLERARRSLMTRMTAEAAA